MAANGLAPGYRNIVAALRLFKTSLPGPDQVPSLRAKTSAWITRWKLPESAASPPPKDIPGGRVFRASETVKGHAFYLHGGGLVFYTIEDFRTLMAQLADTSGCEVTVFEYPKAPENSAREIVETIAASIDRRLAEIPEGEPIVLAGDSIGGYMALYLALRRFPKRFARLVLIYPVLDLHHRRASYVTYGRGYCLNADMMEWFQSLWHSHDGCANDFSAFDLSENDRKNLPDTFVISAEMDVLRDESFEWCSYLQSNNLPVSHFNMAGLAHDFCLYAGAVPEARAAVDLIAGRLRVEPGRPEQHS